MPRVRAVSPDVRAAPDGPFGVIGAGGVGGYFAAVLARAGGPVRVLARGAHLAAIQARGAIEIREPSGERFTADIGATDDPAALGGSAYVLVAVKSYSLSEIAGTLRTLAENGSVIVPLLNGVATDDWLAALGVPRNAILGGLTYISAARTAPGVVARAGDYRSIIVGEFSGVLSPRAEDLAARLRAAGIDSRATDAVDVELWRKFAFIAPMAAVCGVGRRPAGVMRSAPFGRTAIEHALREVIAVGRASGVPLRDEIVPETMQAFDALPLHARPSFLLDVERGGPNELDALSGTVARLGHALGVDTPVHDLAVAVLSRPSASPG